MIFVKVSLNLIKSHLKCWLISQISVHKLWHVCRWIVAIQEGLDGGSGIHYSLKI